MTSSTAAVSLALAAALGFAFSTSIQHVAAGSVPTSVSNPLYVLLNLLRSPRWIAGSSIGLASWFLHAVALHYGTLSLVQPIILLGVVLAVVVRAGLDRSLPGRNELIGVVVTVVSLIAVVSQADTERTDSPPAAGTMIAVAAVGVLIAAVVTTMANSLPRRGVAAFFLGMTAGMLFGITACLMKIVGSVVADDGAANVLWHWSSWVLLGCAVFAMSLNQRAYQLSRLSHSTPVVNVTSVLLSIILGAALFGESLSTAPSAIALQIIGLVGIGWGLYRIADYEDPARVI